MDDRHVAIFIRLISFAFDKICMHQTHFVAGEEAEILLRRLDHEILPLNIQFTAEGNLAHSKFRILHIVVHFQILHFPFRVIINHQFDGVKNGHHSGLLQLQVLPDAVFKHGIIHGTLAFGYAAHIHEHLDGFRRKSPPP